MNAVEREKVLFGAVLPVMLFLSFATAVRLCWTLWDIRAADSRVPDIPAARPAARNPGGGKRGTAEGEGTAAPVPPGEARKRNAGPGGSLFRGWEPGGEKVLFRLRVDDFPGTLRRIRSLPWEKLLGVAGVREALSPLEEKLEGGRRRWEKMAGVPLHRVLQGLGPFVESLECVVTGWSVSRRGIRPRLAAVCRVKEEDVLRKRLEKNAAGFFRRKRVRDVPVLVSARKGWDPVCAFVYRGAFFFTVGEGMDAHVLASLGNGGKHGGGKPGKGEGGVRGGIHLFVHEEMMRRFFPRWNGGMELACIVRDGGVEEKIVFPALVLRRYVAPPARAARAGTGKEKNVLLAVEAKPTREGIELLGSLSRALYGMPGRVKVNGNLQGSFWDYLYALSEASAEPTAGFLAWSPEEPLPSWCFLTRLGAGAGVRARLVQARRSLGSTAFSRAGTSGYIIPLRRSLGFFGSFSYLEEEGGKILYSYNTRILSRLSGRRTPEGGRDAAGEILAVFFDPESLGRFIEEKNVRGLLASTGWARPGLIKDMEKAGRILGPYRVSARIAGAKAVVTVRSAFGATGAAPAVLYAVDECHLMEE